MKYAPCERLAMRIKPKISEKPAASVNSTPPRARLFRLWISQKFMPRLYPPMDYFEGLLLEVLGCRIVARVDRRSEEVRLLVSPELAHLRVGLDHGVGQLAIY